MPVISSNIAGPSFKADTKKQPLSYSQMSEEVSSEKKKYTQKDARKRWGITMGVIGGLSVVGSLLSAKVINKAAQKSDLVKKVELKPLAVVASALSTGIFTGSEVHFMFTKNSKLNKDKATDSVAKRTGIIAGLALASSAISLSSKSKVKALQSQFKTKKGAPVLVATSTVMSAGTYLLAEGVKSLIDKSVKKEKAEAQKELLVKQRNEALTKK